MRVDLGQAAPVPQQRTPRVRVSLQQGSAQVPLHGRDPITSVLRNEVVKSYQTVMPHELQQRLRRLPPRRDVNCGQNRWLAKVASHRLHPVRRAQRVQLGGTRRALPRPTTSPWQRLTTCRAERLGDAESPTFVQRRVDPETRPFIVAAR